MIWIFSTYNYLTYNVFYLCHPRTEIVRGQGFFFFFRQYLSLLRFQCLEQYLAHRRGSIIFADWMISKWMNIKAKKKYKEKNMILCRFSHWNILNETRVISVFWLLTHFEAWAWLMFQLHNLTRIFKLYQNLQRSKNKNTKEKKISGECEQWEHFLNLWKNI